MRQVVNGAKGGPLLGQSSCIIRSKEQHDDDEKPQQHMLRDDYGFEEEEEDMMMMVDDGSSEEQVNNSHHHPQQRRRHPHSPKAKGPRQQIERERRLRREIANSNERRRMQSINQGYMSLKRMLPVGDSGEKLSKAAVLQNAADYMSQILEERKQLLIRNAELTQALNAQRQLEEAVPARRKRDMTESSDEGISMSYQPVSHESEVVEELRRTVTELRIQLEREGQRRTLIEQSYTYSLMAAQAATQPKLAGELTQQQIPTTVVATPLSPPQSRHGSTDEHASEPVHYPSAEMYDRQIVGTASTPCSHSPAEPQQTFGKASSVASQNLSIIVEAINHLEGDTHQQPPTLDKEADSGISHGESSDESKSERSISGTPQPPPAHQSTALLSTISHHRPNVSTPYSAQTLDQQVQYCGPVVTAATAAVPLLYRPTFLSNYMSSQQSAVSNNYITPPQ